MSARLLFVINEAYFFLSHRLAVAKAAMDDGWEVHVAAPKEHVWAPPNFSVDELKKEGFIFHSIPLSRRGTNPLVEIKTFFSLLKLYQKIRPDIIHHITIKPNLYGGLAARLTGIPSVVFAFTGLGQIFIDRGLKAYFLRAIVKALLGISLNHSNKKIIFQNMDDQENFINLRIISRESSVVIRGSGVDLDKFSFTPITKGTPMVVLASRLIWEKGVSDFVSAARLLHKKNIKARFILVGDTQPSNPRAVPKSVLETWVRENIIEWWGYRSDMTSILSQCHIVCLPSIYGEGVPKILLEAAAVGRAVVSNNVPGCREAVIDGVSGYLVPPKDIDALADRLYELIKNPDLADRLGREGRQFMEDAFDEHSIASTTLMVYRSLWNQKKTMDE